MDATDILIEKLKVTQGDVQAQAALMAEFRLSVCPEPQRHAMREALDAAAVLHWFDAGLLARTLLIPEAETQGRFEQLKALSFVEPYGRPDRGLFNVHEATRLGWRRRLAAEDPGRLRALSARAADCFAGDLTPGGRIEWVYHLLCADPDGGAGALESLDREWTNSARPEDRVALARVLDELACVGLVAGRARAWALLVSAQVRHARGETARLGDIAMEALQLAKERADSAGEAEARCLLGDVWYAQGRLDGAQAAFAGYLAISQRLAEEDPDNAGRQRELALAHSRVGDVLPAQGRLAEAQAAFAEDLAISRHLAEQDPGNAGWQRELAVARGRVGEVLQAQGRLSEAQVAFGETLAIFRRLADQDSGNASWQRDLAVAHSKIGDVLQAQGQLAEAQAAFGEYLAISRRLAEQDPDNAGWQRGLAVAHGRVGEVLQAQGHLVEAQAAFAEYLAIVLRLADQDPGNANWQHGLAVGCINLARIERRIGRAQAALSLYEESAHRFAALGERAPGFAQWAEESAFAESELADYRASLARANQAPPQA